MKIAGVYAQKMDIDKKLQHVYGQPTGLQQILGAVEKNGYETKLFYPLIYTTGEENFINMDEKDFVDSIVEYSPDIIAFSVMTAQFSYTKKIAKMLKKRLPSSIIVAGGRHPSFSVEDLKYPFDIYVIGEGEIIFLNLVKAIEKNKRLNEINGIAYLENGNIVQTKREARIQDLDKISVLKKDSVLFHLIYKGMSLPSYRKKPKYALIEYSRGCSGRCEFCDNTHMWKCATYRNASLVVDDMKALKEKYGTEVFYIFDLNFTSNEKKAYEFCNEISKKNLKVNWYCMSNIVTAKEPLVKAMKETGCYRICYGVESTSNVSFTRMRKIINKKETLLQVEKAQEVLEMSANCGIINNMYTIIGLPWETEEMILEGQYILNNYNGHQINVGIFTPHYGTVLREKMIKEGYKFDSNFDKYNRGSLVYNHKYITRNRMKALQLKLYKGFYNSNAYAERVNFFLHKFPYFTDSFVDYFENMDINNPTLMASLFAKKCQ